MTKAYRRRDRAWRGCISLEEFQRIARETVGKERPNKEADDWCKNLFGKVASPGVKDPLRRKQREEAILADLNRVEGNHRGGDHSKKRKRVINLSEDRRPSRRESTYLENTGRDIEWGSPSKAVLAQQHELLSPISPSTPTRQRPSRGLAPLASVTNVAAASPATPPKSPLDGKGRSRHGLGQGGKEDGSKDSKTRLSGNLDPFVDNERGGRANLNTRHLFTFPPPVLPPPSASELISYRSRMDFQVDPNAHATTKGLPANINVEPGAKQATPLPPQVDAEGHSQPVAGKSLPTPVSNGPAKRVPPPINSPTATGPDLVSIGMKRTRETEDVGSSKKVVLAGSSRPVQKIPGPSRDRKPSETWSPDETTFMEDPHSKRGVSKFKTRKGDMSVDAIKARLIRATSTLQILPSSRPDTAAQNPGITNAKPTTIEKEALHERTLGDDTKPIRPKVGSSTLSFGIPAPFPPGTTGPESSLERPNNSDKIAAYHGADKFYSGRPPSATPPQQQKVSEPGNEDRKSLDTSTKQDVAERQLGQQKAEQSKTVVGRFPSFVLEPQQLLFTDTAIGVLMSTSVVWFAREIHHLEPPYRPSSLQLVPRMNEVSQLDSLLVACGWHRKKAFSSKRGVERGVVFVDYEEQSDTHPIVKTHWTVQQCENAYRLATQYQTPAEGGMKPIWIMDARVLRWERLRLMKPGNSLDTFEEFVLWKHL